MASPKELRPGPGNIAERIKLSEVIYLLKEKKLYVILLTSLTLAGTIISHFLYIPSYIASVRLEVQRSRDNALTRLASPDFANMGYATDDVGEMQRHSSHLRSGSFYLKVAERLISRPEYLTLNLTQPWELTLLSRKFWKVRLKKSTMISPKESAARKEVSKNPRRMDIEYLADLISAGTVVSTDSQWLVITVKSFDPNTSNFIANLQAETYAEMTLEQEQNDLNEMYKFVKARLEETGEHLRASEAEIVEFKSKNSVFSPEDVTKIYGERVREVEAQLGAIRVKMSENNNLIQFYENKLEKNADSIVNNTSSEGTSADDPRALSRNLDSLRRKKALYATQGLSDQDPKVIEVNTLLKQNAEQLKKQMSEGKIPEEDELPLNYSVLQGKIIELQSANKLFSTQIKTLETTREEALKSISHLPKVEQELFRRVENLKLDYEMYSSLRKKLQDIEIQRLAVKSPIRVDALSYSAPPEVRVSLMVRLPFSMLVGIFLGALVVLFLEISNTSVRHASDLEAFDLVILGNIPHVDSKLGALLRPGEVNTDLLICETRPNSAEAMAFKYVREQLKVSVTSQGKPVRSITISGTDKHEGKTFFASNLSIALARMDKKVLMVDCDLRAPTVHKYFDLPNKNGLSSFLEKPDAKMDDFLFKGRLKNLDIMTAGAGHPHPTELIGSDRFRNFVHGVMNEYEYVILDAPPAVYVADAPVLAGVTDSVILVASYRVTKRASLLMAHRKIFQISHRRAFGVLNNVPMAAHEFTPYVVTLNEYRAQKREGTGTKS